MGSRKCFIGRGICAAYAASVVVMMASMPALAGQWRQDATGWWYEDEDGTWPSKRWRWIDGNGDGVYERYYFDASGYMLANCETPDHNWVNADGAWIYDESDGIVAGEVRTRQLDGSLMADMIGYYQTRDADSKIAALDVQFSPENKYGPDLALFLSNRTAGDYGPFFSSFGYYCVKREGNVCYLRTKYSNTGKALDATEIQNLTIEKTPEGIRILECAGMPSAVNKLFEYAASQWTGDLLSEEEFGVTQSFWDHGLVQMLPLD